MSIEGPEEWASDETIERRRKMLLAHIANGGRSDGAPLVDVDRALGDPSPADRFRTNMCVTDGLCRWINRASSAGMSSGQIARKVGIPGSTVRHHINGKCTHEKPRVDDRMCNAIRCLSHDGMTYREIADTFQHAPNPSTCFRHATGKCNCDSTVVPVETSSTA